MKRINIFLLVILVRGFAYSSCEDIRLDKTSMASIPVMDQDGTSLCYAYSASQMIDAWRFSHGDKNTNHLTSPIFTAVKYKESYNKDKLNFGYISNSINTSIKNGSCNHNNVFPTISDTQQSEFLILLNSKFNKYTEDQDLEKAIESIQCLQRSNSIDGKTSDFREIGIALMQKNSVQFIKKMLEPICQKNLISLNQIPAAKYLDTINLSRPAESYSLKMTQKINSFFDKKNPQPVGIHYCSDFLENKQSNAAQLGIINQNCQTVHESILVGRRIKNGQCQFLIRNSMGESCNQYDGWECEKGQIWVDAKTIAKNTARLDWIE